MRVSALKSTEDRQQQVLQEHASLIHQVVAACESPRLFPGLNAQLHQAEQNGWTALIAAIRRILDGERDVDAFEGLDDEDTIIVVAIVRGIQDRTTLPNPSSLIDASSAGPLIATLIARSRRNEKGASESLAAIEIQLNQAGGDLPLIGSALRRIIAGDYRFDQLFPKMSSDSVEIIRRILAELKNIEIEEELDSSGQPPIDIGNANTHRRETGGVRARPTTPSSGDGGNLFVEHGNYLPSVREQYENYPYPRRDPKDEMRTLFVTSTEHLGKISHYGFRGLRDLRKRARFLVAGGGTGDAAIYLAEQLRGTGSKVVYLDLSSASMAIAKERARNRNLDNIIWIHGSILDLPRLAVGEFDFINCCGVLHHLEDPAAGLDSLKSVLSHDGCMALMVYAEYGRTGIYQMQKLLRILRDEGDDITVSLGDARAIMQSLPETNWYKRDEARWKSEIDSDGDIAIYDLFLHAQDRAYAVPQLYEWIEGANLNIITLTGFAGHAVKYEPWRYIRDDSLREKINLMPVRKQQAVAELLNGGIKTHTIYVSRHCSTIASADDHDMIPYYTFRFASGEQLYRGMTHNPEKPLRLTIGKGADDVLIEQRPHTRHVLRYIDGQRTLAEIYYCIQQEKKSVGSPVPSISELSDTFKDIYQTMVNNELMLLRGKNIPPYSNPDDLIERMPKMS